MSLHHIITQSAQGRLPQWAVAGDDRRAHMGRVAESLTEWAEALELTQDERVRWRSVGYLHDVLRDEEFSALRDRIPPDLKCLPGPLLHGPAAAERLRVAGVLDGELLSAIAFHTVGDASFGPLGRALYAADFLEPGRTFLSDWRAERRARMPAELDDVVFEIVRARVVDLVERGAEVLPRTLGFWNALVAERS